MNFKKLIKVSASALTILGMSLAIACGSDDPTPNPNPTPTPDPDPEPDGIENLEKNLNLTLSRSHAQYFGDYYGNGTSNYVVYCYDQAYDEARLRLDLIGPALPENPSSVLAAGTYTIGTETTEFHCAPGVMTEESIEGSWYENSTTNEVGWLASGTITVTEAAGQVYTIEVDATTDLGYTVKGTYTGGVLFIEGSTYTPTSTLSADCSLTGLPTEGIYTFYGDVLGVDLGYTIIDIAAKNPGDNGFAIALLQEDPNATELVEGTYAVASSAAANVLYPGMAQNGSFEPTAYYAIGTQTAQDGIQAPIQAGTIVLSKLDDTTWQIEIDTYDDANNHIFGTWTGPLTEQAAQ